MRYSCLVLDHDDTVVNSTATVHYPSFLAFMALYRPNGPSFTLEDYFLQNFHPGVLPFFRDVVGLSEEELNEEYKFWDQYVQTRVPHAYDGIRPLLWRFRQQGGHICVVSHSLRHNILRDYRENGLPEPELVFGWDDPPEQRKPNPYPLQAIMETLHLEPQQLLMLDDLKPGCDMARSCGVPFAAAGWANDIPQIEEFMRQNSDFYFKTVAELADFLA